jgi:Holliday junction resolvase
MNIPKRNKQRGYEFEAELVKKAKAEGLEAKRAWCSDGRSIGLDADVDVLIDVYNVQAKRRKKLPSYLQIPDSCDAVAFRQDRGETLVLLTLSEWLHMVKQIKEES